MTPCLVGRGRQLYARRQQRPGRERANEGTRMVQVSYLGGAPCGRSGLVQ